MRNLLVRGNGKLGGAIFGWSLPAVATCPGRSALCESHCYARHGNFVWDSVQDLYTRNLRVSRGDGFAARMAREIVRRRVQVCRPHVSGDFYDSPYVQKWTEVAVACPDTTFYAYTRSWRVEEMRGALLNLGSLENVRLWLSADADTGMPLGWSFPVAYMATEGDKVIPPGVDLVFRVKGLRSVPERKIGLAVVCPTETGLPQAKLVTCTSCRRCYA